MKKDERILEIIERMDTEINSVMNLIQHTDVADPDYLTYTKRLGQLIKAKEKFMGTIDSRYLDTRNGFEKFLDGINPTDVIKCGTVLAGLLLVMNYESLGEILSGAGGSIATKMLTMKL